MDCFNRPDVTSRILYLQKTKKKNDHFCSLDTITYIKISHSFKQNLNILHIFYIFSNEYSVVLVFSHNVLFKILLSCQHCELNQHELVNDSQLIFPSLQVLTTHPDIYRSFTSFKTSQNSEEFFLHCTVIIYLPALIIHLFLVILLWHKTTFSVILQLFPSNPPKHKLHTSEIYVFI